MKKQKKQFSIVQPGMTIEGNLSAKGEMVIGGRVKGNISVDHVIISGNGDVSASVRAKSVTVAGRFSGEIIAQDVTVVESGSCSGEVACLNLVIAPGGHLNASVTRLSPETPSAPSHGSHQSPSYEKAAVTGK